VNAYTGFLCSGYFSKNGVDHAGGMGFACGAGKFNALTEGGVGGDAVEMQELEGAETEGDGYGFCEALLGALEEGADAGIECDLPAEDSHNQRGSKIAIFGRESVDTGRMEELVAVAFVLADECEDLEGGEAGWGDLFQRCLDGDGWACGGGALARWREFCGLFGRWFRHGGFFSVLRIL